MNNRLKKLIAGLVAIAAGAVFIVFGFISLKELREFKQVEALVSDIQVDLVTEGDGSQTQEIHIFVTYTVNGQEYTEELQNTKTSMKKGDTITVLYNPENPKEVSGATKGIATVQLAAGAAIALFGLGFAALTLIRGR